MKKKAEQPVSHPDDLIVVGIRFSFQAKENPDGDDRLPLPAVDIEQTFEAPDSVEFLDEVVAAIRDRRLFGFIMQERANTAVSSGDWVKKTFKEMISESDDGSPTIKLPNVQTISSR
jgi:hypothetical protein